MYICYALISSIVLYSIRLLPTMHCLPGNVCIATGHIVSTHKRLHCMKHAKTKPTNPITPSDWVSKQTILQTFFISDRTLQSWRSKGLLKHYKINQTILYKWSEVLEFIESNRRGG